MLQVGGEADSHIWGPGVPLLGGPVGLSQVDQGPPCWVLQLTAKVCAELARFCREAGPWHAELGTGS